MPESQGSRPRDEGEAQSATSREGEGMADAHGESGSGGPPTPPEAGHPVAGEGTGMPEEGAGRAKEKSTQPISTEDQGNPTDTALEGEQN